jgi:predicted acetyltransferase
VSSPEEAGPVVKSGPAAVLLPTESQQYGRYGYGMASRHAAFTIGRGEGALARDVPADPEIRLRIAAPHDVRSEIAPFTTRRDRPGFLSRAAVWWDRVLRDPGGGYAPLWCLRAEDAAGPRGYALYAGDNRWEDKDGLTDCMLRIRARRRRARGERGTVG